MTIRTSHYQGQTYDFVGEEPYRNQFGDTVTLELWRSRCADCGREIVVKTSKGKKFAPSRRCAEHKSPGRRVK